MIVAFIGKVLTEKIERENFDESLAVRQNSSDFFTIKVLRYTVAMSTTSTPYLYHKTICTEQDMIKEYKTQLHVKEKFIKREYKVYTKHMNIAIVY